MQKIFMRYTVLIMTIAICSILVINFFFSLNSLEEQQRTAFDVKIGQVIHTMVYNQGELEAIKKNLDEDYLTRAKAAAYVVEKNPGVLDSVEELKNLASLLDVDELHVTNSDGIIRYSSVPRYIGLDFHNGEQMRGFLPILESDREDLYIIQEAQPNTAEGKMMKYVGVSRKGVKGMVQVGLEPVRQMEAQERNTYAYIFSRFPTDVGEEFFAVNLDSGELAAYTGKEEIAEDFAFFGPDTAEVYKDGGYFTKKNGSKHYVMTECFEHVLIGASISTKVFYRSIWKNFLLTALCLVLIEIVTVIVLNYLIKKRVVNGTHEICNELKKITDGNLNTSVKVGGNPEFEELSHGINAMVESIASSSDRISRIIAMSEVPLAAFEYRQDMNYVFATSKLGDLLNISEEELDKLVKHPSLFLQRIRTIMDCRVEHEENVYFITTKKYIRIHMTEEYCGYFGAVTDASSEILDKRRILYENNHDQLTGLARYAHFKQIVSQVLEGSSPEDICACVMMDLDGFKNINDSYGHDVGDHYLQEFAELMKELQGGNCLVSRRSGDEFCMFIYGCKNTAEVKELLESFWVRMGERKVYLDGKHSLSIKASGGYACGTGRDAGLDQLLKLADQALYEVKRTVKGSFGSAEPDKY